MPGENQTVSVVYITYRSNRKRLPIETWGVVDNPGTVTRSTPLKVLALTTSIAIANRGYPYYTDLRIPYRSIGT